MVRDFQELLDRLCNQTPIKKRTIAEILGPITESVDVSLDRKEDMRLFIEKAKARSALWTSRTQPGCKPE